MSLDFRFWILDWGDRCLLRAGKRLPTYFFLLICSIIIAVGVETQQGVSGNAAQPTKLDVVYPRLEGRDTVFVLPRVDSTFAFGSVQPTASEVYVNGGAAQVWENGAFLAFVPVDTNSGNFAFLAVSPAGDTARVTIPFRFPPEGGAALSPTPHPINRRLPGRITISQEHAYLRTAPDEPMHSFRQCTASLWRIRSPRAATACGWAAECMVGLKSALSHWIRRAMMNRNVPLPGW